MNKPNPNYPSKNPGKPSGPGRGNTPKINGERTPAPTWQPHRTDRQPPEDKGAYVKRGAW